MEKLTYEKAITALLVIYPYNDFISDGGKLWNRVCSHRGPQRERQQTGQVRRVPGEKPGCAGSASGQVTHVVLAQRPNLCRTPRLRLA